MTVSELVWLADSLRNQGLAVENPPARIQGLEWSDGLAHKVVDLRYAPRAIAVSPNGAHVAVGTKAGCLHTLSFEAGTWRESVREDAGTQADAEGALRRYAIRGLCFLDNQHLLASFGLGTFKILTAAASQRVVEGRPSRGSAFEPFLDQVHTLVPLWDQSVGPEHEGPVAMGLTASEQPLFFFWKAGGAYSKKMAHAQHFEPLTLGTRVVGGVWSQKRLWLLDELGTLASYAGVPGTDAGSLRRERLSVTRIKSPPSGARFTSMAGGDDGLAVQAGEYITLVRTESIHRQLESQATLEPDWLHSPGTTSVAVIRPFARGQSPTRENPVWMYTVSSVSGLVWVPWFERDEPAGDTARDARNGPRSGEGFSLNRPLAIRSRAPFRSLAATGSSHVAHVAAGTLQSTHGRAPCYLVFATREEQLRLISFIEMESTSERLARALPAQLKASENKDALRSAGLTLWLARRQLYESFELKVESTLRPRGSRKQRRRNTSLPPIENVEHTYLSPTPPGSTPPAWLSQLEGEDVEELARDLVEVLRRRREEKLSDAKAEQFFQCFRHWTFLLLYRATQIDTTLYPTLATDLALKLCSGIERSASSSMLGVRKLGAALRKWIVFGDTFAAKSCRLWDHAEWNWQGRRTIDGAVYASKLLNARVDLLAESSLPASQPNAGTWGLAVALDGSFSVQSHTDGRITACTCEGTTILWSLSEACDGFETGGDWPALERSDTKKFREHLWYGPLSRAVVLIEQPDERFLLVCSARGWPGTAHKRNTPAIHVLLIRPEWGLVSRRGVTSQSAKLPRRLVVEQAKSIELEHAQEIFSLIVMPAGPNVTSGPARCIELLAGSLWGGKQRDEHKAPFVELRIQRTSRTGGLLIQHVNPNLEFSELPGRSVPAPEDCNHNPVRALALFCFEDGRSWLFAGQDDGRIRLFERRQGSWRELERFGPLSLASGVRALAVQAIDARNLLLAFGTADGTVGLLPVDIDACGVTRDPGPDAASPASSLLLLSHTREAAEICGAAFYEDEPYGGDEPEAAALPRRARRLMVLTRGGVISLYDADLFARKTSPPLSSERVLRWDPEVRARRSVAGWRLDHFNLDLEARALALSPTPGDSAPRLVVGGADGQVRFYELAAPKGGQRRRKLADQCWQPVQDFESSGDAIIKDAIDRPLLLPWLRVAQVGSLHLVRYSLWLELGESAQHVTQALARNAPDFDEVSKAYLATIDRLADEVFRRRPFSKEPVKIIWEEGAKVANFVATRALTDPKFATPGLRAFTELGQRLSRLCNQWVGYEQRLESRVLIHSFNALMDWQSVVLLSFSGTDPTQHEARRFIMEELIQRRLFFHDLIVPLEALRVINMAVLRAIELRARDVAAARAERLDFSFFDLIAMVATLAERRHTQLDAQHPLGSEIIQFFSLALLWIPDGVFALGATISECGLTERRRDVGKIVHDQARRLCEQLAKELDCTNLDEHERRLERYTDYLAWREVARLPKTQVKPEQSNEHELSDSRLMRESRTMTLAAQALRDPMALPGSDDDVIERCFSMNVPERDCLTHSRKCLRVLRDHRRELRERLHEALRTFEVDAGRTHYEAAKKICDSAEAELMKPGAIFEPQRSNYLEIVAAWRDRIQREQEYPRQMLHLMERFNRHVYQATADDLAASLQELVLRTVPLSFSELKNADDEAESLRSLSRRGLDAHPVLKDVFDRGIRLVEDAHLSATLLAVAKAVASGNPLHAPTHDGIWSGEELRRRLSQLCRSNGLNHANGLNHGLGLDILKGFIPGTADVWDAILQEWTRNVRKYGTTKARRFTAWTANEPRSTVLMMWGDRPFWDSVSEKWRRHRPYELIDKIGSTVGTRLASSDERPGGFGLPLVLWLCRNARLETSLVLCVDGRVIEPDAHLDEQHRAPLALRIEWPVS